jgi:ribosomal protein L37AE/L43A
VAVWESVAEIRTMLENIALAVKEMHATLDDLWQRRCPQCLHVLTKSDPAEKWKCSQCGWEE